MKKKVLATRFTATAVVAAAVLSPVAASAVTGDTTINASVGSAITMTTSSTVAINVTPTTNGSLSSASDTVTVSTNNTGGYTLTLANADTDTDLTNGGSTISAASYDQSSPGTLDNAWGYRVDGVGGFGAGTTSAELNATTGGSYSWAGVPASGSPATLKVTGETASSDITTVWYGVEVDSTIPNGTYSDTVTYTATTN